VVGTGQAGPSLAAKLAASGQTVAIVERGQFGGTCVNTGCIPTKTMVASARAAYIARRASDFGVIIDGAVHVDMKQVKARKDEVSGSSQESIERWLRTTKNCTVYAGHARFLSDHELRVTGRDNVAITADRIFLNVGGRAAIPALEGIGGVRYLTNASMMDMDFLPEHLVIVGGSYIGLEFAQMFRRFGSRVTVIERRGRLLGVEDEDVSEAIHQILTGEGIDIRLSSECLAVKPSGEAAEVRVHCTDEQPTIRGSHVLIATGRRPNTDDLGLEHTSVQRDERGYIRVDEELRTTAPGIWALGDCNGRGAFTHTSYNDFEIVSANLLNGEHRRVSDRIPAYALYIDPPLGRAGMTDAEVRETGRRALTGMRPMTKVGRAREKGETQGFMKITVDADSKEILGAAILGTEGDEAIHCILDMMYAKAPYTVLQRAMHIHPTVSELIPTILGELQPLRATSADYGSSAS
jgi:pyruvate/2-oxoglutarate dehydrogenase complex dihydrolipoamide dehydrogenase (E3) component